MKIYMTASAALLLTTTIATAGGLDRSGQGIGVIFEDGNYAELSFGNVSPSISGVANPGLPAGIGGGGASGNIAPAYTQVGAGMKMQLSEQLSAALIYDQPFGASVDYPAAPYPASGATATVKSNGVTALFRNEINSSFSLHGGLRYVAANGVYTPNNNYSSTYSEGTGTGYVIGGAYERDDIAMRIALTYSSEIELSTLEGTAGNLTTTLPRSINLDFQTGIAADTLLFGSVRYVAWNGFSLDDSVVAGSILSYDEDVNTYNIGIGRRLSDNLAASFAVGYEASTGEQTGQLGPTDGYISYQVGAVYTLDSGVELSGGIRYVNIGDAETEEFVAGTGYGGRFSENSAVAIGLKIGFTF